MAIIYHQWMGDDDDRDTFEPLVHPYDCHCYECEGYRERIDAKDDDESLYEQESAEG